MAPVIKKDPTYTKPSDLSRLIGLGKPLSQGRGDGVDTDPATPRGTPRGATPQVNATPSAPRGTPRSDPTFTGTSGNTSWADNFGANNTPDVYRNTVGDFANQQAQNQQAVQAYLAALNAQNSIYDAITGGAGAASGGGGGGGGSGSYADLLGNPDILQLAAQSVPQFTPQDIAAVKKPYDVALDNSRGYGDLATKSIEQGRTDALSRLAALQQDYQGQQGKYAPQALQASAVPAGADPGLQAQSQGRLDDLHGRDQALFDRMNQLQSQTFNDRQATTNEVAQSAASQSQFNTQSLLQQILGAQGGAVSKATQANAEGEAAQKAKVAETMLNLYLQQAQLQAKAASSGGGGGAKAAKDPLTMIQEIGLIKDLYAPTSKDTAPDPFAQQYLGNYLTRGGDPLEALNNSVAQGLISPDQASKLLSGYSGTSVPDPAAQAQQSAIQSVIAGHYPGVLQALQQRDAAATAPVTNQALRSFLKR